MPITLNEVNEGRVLEVQVSGKLIHSDYVLLVPKFERLLKQHGKISLLFEMVNFHGWDGAAIWDDFKLGVNHFSDIERLAMVGDKKWEKAMSVFCRPFTRAQVLSRFEIRMRLNEW